MNSHHLIKVKDVKVCYKHSSFFTLYRIHVIAFLLFNTEVVDKKHLQTREMNSRWMHLPMNS